MKKNKSTHWAIVLGVFFIGESFIPVSPNKISFPSLIISIIIMSINLIAFILIINNITNSGKLFNKNKIFSTKEKILFSIILIYFAILFIPNGNIQSIVDLSKSSFKTIITVIATAIGAGFFEEYLVRGFLFTKFQNLLARHRIDKYTLTIPSLLTNAIFGLLHITNIAVSPVDAVYQQIFYTSCLGLIFCSIRIITNNILIVAIIHSILDLQVTIGDPLHVNPWLELVVAYLPLAILSFILIMTIDRSNHTKENEDYIY